MSRNVFETLCKVVSTSYDTIVTDDDCSYRYFALIESITSLFEGLLHIVNIGHLAMMQK